MEEFQLKRLGLIINQIENATAIALNFLIDIDNIEQAEITEKKLQTSINRFSIELNNYFRLNTEPSADIISSFSETQLRGEEVLSELTIKLKNFKENQAVSNNKQREGSSVSSKLPKLNLPEFSDNILDWHQFWDQFESNIHQRNISEVDKLLYLKSSLKGEAKKSIDGLETTNKNYEIAVSTLKTRYGKPNHIIDAHYAALYRVKAASDTNISEVRQTLNEIEKHLRVLKSLGENINHNHLRFLIMEKMPSEIIYELKLKKNTESIDEIRSQLELIVTAREDANRITTDNKREFTTQNLHVNTYEKKRKYKEVKNRFQRSEDKKENKNGEKNRMPRDDYKRPLKRKPENNDSTTEGVKYGKRRNVQCIFCNGGHYNDQCQVVKTLQERKAKLKNRCYGCFYKGHSIQNCKRNFYCRHCKKTKLHNRALCPEVCVAKVEQTTTLHAYSKSTTILQTAIVNAQRDNQSKGIQCRVLLDSGSQRSYVTKEMVKKLQLPTEEENTLSVFTFGSKTPQLIKSDIVKLNIKTRTNMDLVIFANVVPHISEGIPYPESELRHWKGKTVLADDGSLSSKIDILIGNDYYFSLILQNKIKLDENLFLIESKLGWILSGISNVPDADDLSVVTYFQTTENKLTQPDLPLDNGNIKCLWELESIGICDSPKVTRDEETIKQFNETIKFINNRYAICWPWIEYPPNLPSNYGLAFGRLVNMLKRINSETLSAYDTTLKYQMEKGIIETVPESQINIEDIDHPVHYLPHHGVSHPGKSIRIVYDASAKTKDTKSLNECLHCGPLMLEDLTGIFLKFRSHRIGITADVEKAFLQIAIQENDKDVTRFLWLKDVSKPATGDNLLHLRFCRVPFGIISSPFLLNATIKHHLLQSNKEILKRIVNDIYVDNLVSGVSSSKEAVTMYKTCKETFHEISMNLREWSSNSETFLKIIPEKDICKDKTIKVLGINWDTKEDTIQLKSKEIIEAHTKREVLKTIASIYDPCGFAVPDLLQAKLFLQKLWMGKFKWDTPLPDDLLVEWQDIIKQLKGIRDITLPRKYFNYKNEKDVQLHAFTDASTKAYAAAVYITNGKEISFVIGKSRLVPIKDQENLKIPRLELLGVLIGSRLLKYVTKVLNFNFAQITIWTDSQIVINWYYSHKLLPPFISRRVEEIKQNVSVIIRYVPSELNSADVATRPASTNTEKRSWLSGPDFLLDDSKTWPASRRSELSFLIAEDLPNEENGEILKDQDLMEESDRSEDQEKTQDVSSENEDRALSHVEMIKRLQAKYFPEEVKGKETNLKRNLGLFTDVDDLLRCKGRLKNAEWSFDKRYPILIPKDCEFTNTLILETHKENYHVGVNHTLSLIRRSYWIPQGRSQVQKILRKCLVCVKHGGGPYKLPPTPALPKERVNYSSPFTYTGLDYLGPLLVKLDNNTNKRWICLYTCLAVRAVHLETVNDLTANECLLALRRFISCRGLPAIIISDNASQFKLTSEVLTNNYCITNGIQWKFIPQLAPWHGGFYERLVGLVKHCLKRTLTKNLLTDSQLNTIIKEIEAVINTRPLTCVGSDLEDILRPSDFLTLSKCIVTTPSDLVLCEGGTVTKQDLIEGWKRGQNMLKEFRRMFTDQYLPSLRERYQNSHKEPRIIKLTTPKIGEIVQIKDDNNKNRECWKVGKISSLLKGSDGLCRVARVKVGDTEFTRAICHLYPLEVEEEAHERESTKHNVNPMIIDTPVTTEMDTEKIDLPVPIEIDSTPQIQEAFTSAERETLEQIKEPESTPEIKADGIEMFQQSDEREHLEEPMMSEIEDVVNINESTDPTEKYDDPNKREMRKASLKAREKIREWTRDLIDLL